MRRFFPCRKKQSRKGENGRVVIVGGSGDYVGAPIFSALGAIATGADLVYLFVPAENFSATRKFSPNILVRKFAGNPEYLSPAALPEILHELNKPHTSLVLGPGLGRDAETVATIQALIQKVKTPLVLDADAILPQKLFPKFKSKNVVLTPHLGELARLVGEKFSLVSRRGKTSTPSVVFQTSKKLGAVILLKGVTDTIASPDGRLRFHQTGDPVLTVGGTGDLLSGMIGALLAHGVPAFEATGMGSFLIGITAEKLAKKYESVTPQLLARELPKVIRAMLA